SPSTRMFPLRATSPSCSPGAAPSALRSSVSRRSSRTSDRHGRRLAGRATMTSGRGAEVPARLVLDAPGFAASFAALLDAKRESSDDVDQIVKDIIDDVIARGDDALIEHTRRLDSFD